MKPLNQAEVFSLEYFKKCDDEAAKAADDYKEFAYQRDIFKELSKDMLASIKGGLRELHDGMSEVKLERLARQSEEWQMFRKQQLEILKDAGRRELEYENKKRKWETARSALSLKRSEISRFGDG